MTEQFKGSPWNCDSIDQWNQPGYWSDYYRDLLADQQDTIRRKLVVWRDCDRLMHTLSRIGKLPVRDGDDEIKFLDAGCGISALPYVLKAWGFHVMALDTCEEAIQISAKRNPSDEDLAKCIRIWEPSRDYRGSFTLIDDPKKSLERLQYLKVAGGSVSFIHADWLDPSVCTGPFDFIYCRNSLRRSKKPYWRDSIQRFYELLAPRGILILETVNALDLMHEVHGLLRETGFVSVEKNPPRDEDHKYVDAYWPTG